MIEEYLAEFPEFYENKISTFDICKELETKALSHSRYDVIPESFKKRRPNETEAAYNYALENYRRISHELIENWTTKSGRIFNSSSFNIGEIGETLSKRLESDYKLFMVNNQKFDWRSYVRHFIYPESLVNPNQIFHFLPINYNAPFEAPYISLPETEEVGLVPMLINYSEIKAAYPNLFIFQHKTEVEAVKIGNQVKMIPVCYAMDLKYWHRLYPVYDKDAKKKFKYVPEIWYTHDFDEVPYLWLTGKYQRNKNGDVYMSSLISSSFEHLDEFVGLFKDSQAVTTQHAYPHMYMAAIDCPACDGVGVDISGDTCKACDGMKVLRKPDPTQVLTVPRTNKLTDGDQIDPIMGWLYPGVDILEAVDNKAIQSLRNAFLSIGLRPFIDVAESGEAKKHRLEDMIDRLEESADIMQSFSIDMLTMIEKYIKYGRGSRDIEEVYVNKPKSFYALNKNEVNLLMTEANGELKREIFKFSFIENNGGSKENLKIAECMFLYAPMLASNLEEMAQLVNLAVYDNNDVIRAINAIDVLQEISSDPAFMSWDKNTIFTNADLKLNDWGLLKLDFLEEIESLDTGNEKAIANTVGGVQGIIGISSAVAKGEMTESAAQNLLMTVYGYSKEQAVNLIDVPKQQSIDE